MSALIGLDWGTSSLRVYAFSDTGEITGSRATGHGILTVTDGAFEAVLRDTAGELLARAPAAPIIASGMIGSRQGWVECPYVACPCSVAELAGQLTTIELGDGRAVHFIPGCSYHDDNGVPDVMRGEETQILGALPGGVGETKDEVLFVLPGTHSKWVHHRAGRIDSFATFMTGELFQALIEHTILGRLADGREHDRAAFLRGVRYAHSSPPGAPPAGILKRLFSARSLTLFDQLEPRQVHSYLSGLLIGTEVAEALASLGAAANGAFGRPEPVEIATPGVRIVGGEALARLYQLALEEFSVTPTIAPGHAAAAGHWQLAAGAGLI